VKSRKKQGIKMEMGDREPKNNPSNRLLRKFIFLLYEYTIANTENERRKKRSLKPPVYKIWHSKKMLGFLTDLCMQSYHNLFMSRLLLLDRNRLLLFVPRKFVRSINVRRWILKVEGNGEVKVENQECRMCISSRGLKMKEMQVKEETRMKKRDNEEEWNVKCKEKFKWKKKMSEISEGIRMVMMRVDMVKKSPAESMPRNEDGE
jgi:hypothetical protein